MRMLLKTPKVQIITILSLLYIVVASIITIPTALYLLITCVGFCVLLDVVFTYARRRKYFTKPFAAVVTGLILTLIIDPAALWYQILIICGAAIGIKNFVRFGNRHILNPAASGLLIGWVFFGLNPSWWGATLYRGDNALVPNILIYLLLAGITYVSCYKIGRYVTVGSYILIYSILFLFVTSSYSVDAFVQTIVSPGMLFYALLMLPEPMTSPVSKMRQLYYGVIVAVLNAVFLYITFTTEIANFPDGSLLALLIGNILFFKLR